MCKVKGIVVALLLCTLLLCGCGKAADSLDYLDNLPANEVNYKTFTVERKEFTLNSGGVVVPYFADKTDYFSPYPNVTFESLAVKRGDTVRVGDVLATFSFPDNSITIQEQQLNYDKTAYRISNQKADYDTRLAAAKEAVSAATDDAARRVAELQLEQQQMNYDAFLRQSESQLQSITDSIRDLKEHSGTYVLRATADGTVSDVATVFAGDTVGTDFKLLTTYSADHFYYEFKNVGPLPLPFGLSVTVNFDERTGLSPITGHIVSSTVGISDAVDNKRVLLQPDTLPSKLTAEGKATGCTMVFSDILLIKESAISTEESSGLSFVYTLENDALQKRYVICGPSADGMVCILDGLTEGQTVISN